MSAIFFKLPIKQALQRQQAQDMYRYPHVLIQYGCNRALTLRQFKEECPPMGLWNIARKMSAICRFPDQVTHADVCQISREVAIPVLYTRFAIDLLHLGMSDVLGIHRENLSDGWTNFDCFYDPVSRTELGSYFASQMIEFRGELRYKFQYVDILLTSALKAPVTHRTITSFNGFENSKDIMLFCGLSIYTLLMACDPRTISGARLSRKRFTKRNLSGA